MSQYIFKARSKEGFCIKLVAELLSTFLKFPPFTINSKGIFLRATDQNREILIDLELPRENFTSYKCPKPLHFIVNSSHFYRLLKTIKKKDSVSLFINEQRPMQLGICVEQNDESADKVTTFINITYVQPEDIDLPLGYGEEPIVVTSKHFQKLKTLHSIGNEMKVTIAGQSIKFYVNGKNLFSREISIGENDDEDGGPTESKPFTQTFATPLITQLTKCAGQSGNVQIYSDEELPLQIKMRTGNLVALTVYIKSKELIEQLEEEAEIQEDMDTEVTAKLAEMATGESKEDDEPEDVDEEEELEEMEEEALEEEEEFEEEVKPMNVRSIARHGNKPQVRVP